MSVCSASTAKSEYEVGFVAIKRCGTRTARSMSRRPGKYRAAPDRPFGLYCSWCRSA